MINCIVQAQYGNGLLQGLRTQQGFQAKLCLIRYRGAISFLECQGRMRFDIMQAPLYRETLGKILGSHDAENPLEGPFYANSYNQETARGYTLVGMQTEVSSLAHNHILTYLCDSNIP